MSQDKVFYQVVPNETLDGFIIWINTMFKQNRFLSDICKLDNILIAHQIDFVTINHYVFSEIDYSSWPPNKLLIF